MKMSNTVCNFCNKTYSTKFNLNKHQKICKGKIKTFEQLESENNKKDKELMEKDEQIAFLKSLLISYANNSNKDNRECNNANNSNKDNRESTNTTNIKNFNQIIINNNFSINDIVSYLEPIDYKEISNAIDCYTVKYMDEGYEGFAKFLCNHPCKEKFITTDNNRSVVSYKTVENMLIKDPQAQMLLNKSLKENADKILSRLSERKEQLSSMLDKNIGDLDDDEIEKEQKKIDDINQLRNSIKKITQDEIVINKKAVNVMTKKGIQNYQLIYEKKDIQNCLESSKE